MGPEKPLPPGSASTWILAIFLSFEPEANVTKIFSGSFWHATGGDLAETGGTPGSGVYGAPECVPLTTAVHPTRVGLSWYAMGPCRVYTKSGKLLRRSAVAVRYACPRDVHTAAVSRDAGAGAGAGAGANANAGAGVREG